MGGGISGRKQRYPGARTAVPPDMGGDTAEQRLECHVATSRCHQKNCENICHLQEKPYLCKPIIIKRI